MAGSSRYLIDTNIVLNWVRGNDLGKSLDMTYSLSAITPGPDVSIVTVGELLAFVGKAGVWRSGLN